jgi:hypothetical protein
VSSCIVEINHDLEKNTFNKPLFWGYTTKRMESTTFKTANRLFWRRWLHNWKPSVSIFLIKIDFMVFRALREIDI